MLNADVTADAADGWPTTHSGRHGRRLNRSRVLSAIRYHDVRARADIAAFTGFTEAAVSRISRELIDAGVLREEEPSPAPQGRAAGRPQIGLELVGSAAHVLAYEIAANAQSVSLRDLKGALVGRNDLDLLNGLKPATALRRAASAGLALIEKAGVSKSRVLGAAVSVAGAVDPDAGILLTAPNIGWHDVPIAGLLAKLLQMPVRVESRASALLLAECRLGVARDAPNVLLINLALGIGGAVLMDGRMARGRRHAAGQIGHMPMPGAKGMCVCSRRGCLDTLASGRAILARLGRLSVHANASSHGPSDAEALRAATVEAERGEGAAVKAFREAGEHLGAALRWAAASLQPDLIVLTGVPSNSAAYVDGVASAYTTAEAAPLVISRIANETAAGELALDAFIYSNGFDLE